MASESPADAQLAKEDVKDIREILSPEERGQLTLLIANIAQVMVKQIRDTFDASTTSLAKPNHILQKGDINPNVNRSGPHKETEEEEKTRKLLERREKELSEPKMLELKNGALKFFEKWRESLTSRLEETVNSLKEVVDEPKYEASISKPQQTAPPIEAQVTSKHYLSNLRLNLVSILT
jgi:hypothetical protein